VDAEERTRAVATAEGESLDFAWAIVEALAADIGPRRPTSRSEAIGAEWLRARLAERGVKAAIEPFRGLSTFAKPYGAVFGLGVAPALLPRRLAGARSTLAGLATALGVAEFDLRLTPVSRALSRAPSQNLVATIEPRGPATRTLCLVSHVDSSRSGLIFHPAVGPQFRGMVAAVSLALLVQSVEPALARSRAGRGALGAARAVLLGALALLAERELRGEDVPGANDNASGAAVTSALAAEVAADPPEHTRVVLLITGCEESGTLGAQAFLREHDTSGWLFLNVDSVGGPATIRFLRREGLVRMWPADPGLISVAERVAEEHPDLELESTETPAGLTYDTTPILARGGRALSISAQDGTIPNYHSPTDVPERIDRDTLSRTLIVGRELIAAVDRGEAD
jgi:hypothetical protein